MDEITEYRISTIDNPYNPWTDFDKWYNYDISNGYGSVELLARLYNESERLSEIDNIRMKNDAIDDIIELNPEFYIKVPKN